jgi:hypothetical protein
MAQADFAIAIVSIILYASLALTSAFYFLKFRHMLQLKNLRPTRDFGRYDEPKILFFLVLFISATLDLPMFIGCVIEGAPKDCEWDSISYPIFWSMHLLAVCGYAFSIVTPPVLWSDIINQKDGKLWFSKYPMDGTKWFFQVTLFLFWSLMVMTVLLVILFYRIDDHKEFTKKNALNTVSSILEPMLTFLISAGCLYCGVRLQLYVMRVRLEGAKEIRFLFHLNITLFIILATYLSRSLMVLRLFVLVSEEYKNAFKSSYFVWILVTRWLPYIFCSFCLINEMRFTGAQIADKYNRSTSVLAQTSSSLHQHSSSQKGKSTSSLGSLLFSHESLSLMSGLSHPSAMSSGNSSSQDYRSQLAQSLLSAAAGGGGGSDEGEFLPRMSYSDEDHSIYLRGNVSDSYEEPYHLSEFMEQGRGGGGTTSSSSQASSSHMSSGQSPNRGGGLLSNGTSTITGSSSAIAFGTSAGSSTSTSNPFLRGSNENGQQLDYFSNSYTDMFSPETSF